MVTPTPGEERPTPRFERELAVSTAWLTIDNIDSNRMTLIAAGDFTQESWPRLQHRLGQLTQAGVLHISVDLAGVDTLDHAAAKGLIDMQRRLSGAGGSLSLLDATPPVAAILSEWR